MTVKPLAQRIGCAGYVSHTQTPEPLKGWVCSDQDRETNKSSWIKINEANNGHKPRYDSESLFRDGDNSVAVDLQLD